MILSRPRMRFARTYMRTRERALVRCEFTRFIGFPQRFDPQRLPLMNLACAKVHPGKAGSSRPAPWGTSPRAAYLQTPRRPVGKTVLYADRRVETLRIGTDREISTILERQGSATIRVTFFGLFPPKEPFGNNLSNSS